VTTREPTRADAPTCRVYVFTYRRSQLLRRAIRSLISQTHTRWICEVHNDDPNDASPGAVVTEFNDPRITLVTHHENYGATKSFNCAFVRVNEEFVSILEDDNSWDPDFLATCIDHLKLNPSASLVWANMQLWNQVSESECIPTSTEFWPQTDKTNRPLPRATSYAWPNARSLSGGLHSNGAMVMRAQHVAEYRIPDCCPFNFIEHVRERTFKYPIVLLRQKLANWTLTLTTARPSNFGQSAAVMIYLGASFLICCHKRRFTMLRIWQTSRRRRQRTVLTLVLAILSNPRLWHLMKFSRPSDYMWCLFDLCKRPLGFIFTLLYYWRLRTLGEFLYRTTRERFIEGKNIQTATVNSEILHGQDAR
jgi:glycosyltransferase involved in cell wall biosynthesis